MLNNEYSFEDGLEDGLYINLADSDAYKIIYNAGMKLPAFMTFGLFDSFINTDSQELIDERLTSMLTDVFLEIKNSDNSHLNINTILEDKEINFDVQLQMSEQYGKIIVLFLPNELS
ncbi:MAG: hypothetical protein P8J51_00825 [Dehalococcoidia bacterium]|nr:hypothetical protein [Dehalococcoidia bacterium]